jgi:hypothetical protein
MMLNTSRSLSIRGRVTGCFLGRFAGLFHSGQSGGTSSGGVHTPGNGGRGGGSSSSFSSIRPLVPLSRPTRSQKFGWRVSQRLKFARPRTADLSVRFRWVHWQCHGEPRQHYGDWPPVLPRRFPSPRTPSHLVRSNQACPAPTHPNTPAFFFFGGGLKFQTNRPPPLRFTCSVRLRPGQMALTRTLFGIWGTEH